MDSMKFVLLKNTYPLVAMENGPCMDDFWWFTDLPKKNGDFP